MDESVVVLQAASDPVRWRILELLGHEELCVCHLVEELGVPQPLVSHHLRVLREARLVESEKFRYWTYYRLVPEAFQAVSRCLVELSKARPRSCERRPCC